MLRDVLANGSRTHFTSLLPHRRQSLAAHISADMSTMTPAMNIEEDLPLVEIIEELDDRNNIVTSRAVILGSADLQASNIQNDDGTPIIEIFEGLDQYDNIISRHTFQVGITHPQLGYEEHMRTAGMKLWTVSNAPTGITLAEEPKFLLFPKFPPEL